MNELDQETKKIITEEEKIRYGVESEFWQIVKSKILLKVNEMNSVSTIDFENKSNEQIGEESKVRANTVKMFYEWISDIEGSAQRSRDTKPIVERNNEPLITTFQ